MNEIEEMLKFEQKYPECKMFVKRDIFTKEWKVGCTRCRHQTGSSVPVEWLKIVGQETYQNAVMSDSYESNDGFRGGKASISYYETLTRNIYDLDVEIVFAYFGRNIIQS